MMKAILIDDEAIILQGLKQLIDWKALGIDIAGEALDGEEGLCLIENVKPDIIISDVAMPNLSGIDMLKKMNERGIHAKTLFLSGYQDFFYAREAMRYGAVDYLLKPVSKEELVAAVKTALDQICEERSFRVLPKRDGKAELIFQDMLQQKERDDSLLHLLQMLDVQHIPGAVCVAMKIVLKNNASDEENKNLVRFEIYEFIRQYLKEGQAGILLRKEYNVCYFLLFTKRDREKVKSFCGKLSEEIRSRYPANLILGCGAWTDCGGKLEYLYRTSRFSLELYYFTMNRYIDYEKIEKDYDCSLEDYQSCVEQLKALIVTDYRSSEISAKILECVELLGNIHYGNRNAVINSCIILAGDIFATLRECGLTDESIAEEQAEFLEEVGKRPVFSQLVTLFEDYYGRTLLKIRLLGPGRESAEIMRIKQYIKDHFMENITLEAIADYIGMNATYMSVFFKRETGQNFKSYVTEVRMKEAVRLLNSTDLKNYELAEAVGYRDAKQFRNNFRELYGIAPQEYKKRGDI